MPRLILPSIQVNMRARRLPSPEANGIRYLKFRLMHWLGAMMTIELKRLRSGGTVWAMVEYSHRFPLVEISTVEGSRRRLVDGI